MLGKLSVPGRPTGWLVGWLVGCFGLNGLSRKYVGLYRAVSQREREREERIDDSKKMSKPPPSAPTASALALL